jgi:hypothetical protein
LFEVNEELIEEIENWDTSKPFGTIKSLAPPEDLILTEEN